MIRLDHLTATPLADAVREEMRPWWEGGEYGSPMHGHQAGMRAAEALTRAREGVAALTGWKTDEVVFTSSGTEATNSALCGWAWRHPGEVIWLTEADHPSVLETARFLARHGHPLRLMPVDSQGFLDPDWVKQNVTGGLLCLHLGNHDSGTLQPAMELIRAGRQQGSVIFCDATSAGGWVSLPTGEACPDLAAMAPSRFHGPAGTGILLVRSGMDLEPLIHGGRQESGRRAGTENLAGWVGAGMACRWMRQHGAAWGHQVRGLRDELWKYLQQQVNDAVLHGPPPGSQRDPRHLAVGFAGVEGEALMRLLDLRGVSVIAASGCLSAAEKYSRALRVMGVPEELARGTILMAPMRLQNKDTMAKAAEIIARAVEKIRAMG